MKQYTKEDVATLIATVEQEFTAHLSKAQESAHAPLAKSEDAKEEKAEKKADEKAPEHKEEKEEHKPEEKSAEPSEEHKEEPKDDAKEEPSEAKEHVHAKEGADNQEGHDYDEQDMEHMHKMYASMSKGELKAHHDSIKKCLDMHMSQAAEHQPMAKSEETAVEVKPEVISTPGPDSEILKSELAAVKADKETLQKNFDAVSEFLGKLLQTKTAPAAKAITSLDAIAKSEGVSEEKTLNKAEIDAVLLKKSSEPTLAKSDRELINAYYLNGGSVQTISHLLK